MNDKLKKALKIGAIALGVGAYTFLAFSVGACAARKGNETKADEIGLRSMSKAPKYAPNVDNADNLLDEPYRLRDASYNPWALNVAPNGSWDLFELRLNTGYYALGYDSGVSGSDNDIWFAGFQCSYSGADALIANIDNNVITATSDISGFTGSFDGSQSIKYLYIEGGLSFFVSVRANLTAHMVAVESINIPQSEVITLPVKWSPLRMVASNVNQENNLVYQTDWDNWAGVPVDSNTGLPTLTLKTILFVNQGNIYNRIDVSFMSLDGKKYATNSNNTQTGVSTDWCVKEVIYRFVVNGMLKRSYVAGSVGTAVVDNQSVLALGINWNNPSARSLGIVDRNYGSFNDTLSGRFPKFGTQMRDAETGDVIRPYGYGIWDIDYLNEYSQVESLDFVLSGNGSVWDLLTNGFNSMLPILNIAVLPGLTFGLLLFLPIIAGIIIVIIKVVKK